MFDSPPPADPRIADAEGPLALYRTRVRAGELVPDPAQSLAIEKLQGLWRALLNYKPGKSGGWRARLGLTPQSEEPPLGLYIFGGVGRGKTMLMDIFFAATGIAKKRRVHFHEFMLEVHDRIHRYRQDGEDGDPIAPIAKAIAGETTLLCFDEFHVTDIADAMILGRLFSGLFDEGVVVVATSNRAPDELYADGLQRERFLPFIATLKEKLDVLELEASRDYRLARLARRPVYFCPLDGDSHEELEHAFADLTDGARGDRVTLDVKGRRLVVSRAAKGVAWFTFDELCVRPLGAADYLAIAERFHTVILAGVPIMGPEQRNEAKRFNTLIDTLYDRRLNLVVSASAPPQELYAEGDGTFEFQRTVSRLVEMQSAEYIEARPDRLA